MERARQLQQFSDQELLDALVSSGLLKRAASERALQAASSTGASIERTCLELGLVPEEALYAELAKWLDLPLVSANELDFALIRTLSLDRGFLERTEVLPAYENEDGTVTVATADPRRPEAIEAISFHLGQSVRPAVCTRSVLRQALASTTGAADTRHDLAEDVDKLRFLSNEGPIVALANDIVSQATDARASDVHVEANETGGQVRFRIDGVLRLVRRLNRDEINMLTSRLKIMANMNISEKRRPQDGRAQIAVLGRNIDLRLSTLPTQFGESVVIRILDQASVDLSWRSLGIDERTQVAVRAILGQASGLFLVAGPTGAGKTTTLYTALSELASDARKIITAEDPIEYAVPGVTQVQVRSEIDMTFARTLRAVLRQDPDTILVGEIRDQETAEIAVRAALVGRLVLSTVHTNDSLTAIDRLLDLGVPPYLLSATLRGVLSQRLARKLCSSCQGAGCSACNRTGYRGRVVVTELMQVPAEAASELSHIRSSIDIGDKSVLRDFPRLADNARELLQKGETSEQELRRLDLM